MKENIKNIVYRTVNLKMKNRMSIKVFKEIKIRWKLPVLVINNIIKKLVSRTNEKFFLGLIENMKIEK